jgi:hypothetical protein
MALVDDGRGEYGRAQMALDEALGSSAGWDGPATPPKGL